MTEASQADFDRMPPKTSGKSVSGCVLIADDDTAIRRLISLLLRQHSFDTDEVSNGLEAIERIRGRRYDAIVLDLMMGPGNGFDVLNELRVLRPHDRCVVVLSASSERNLRDADGPNVAARMRKPFDVTELLAEVSACCRGGIAVPAE